MRYKGNYDTFEKAVKGKSLLQLQEHIEKAAGYNRDSEQSHFKDYQTAWIVEYNIIFGRRTAQYYFSVNDYKWHRMPNRITEYSSWEDSKQPFKTISQWILKVLGYQEEIYHIGA